MELTEKNFQGLMHCIIDQPENYYNVIMGILQKDGMRLADFDAQTEEMCIAAVSQNPKALKYVINPTEQVLYTTFQEFDELVKGATDLIHSPIGGNTWTLLEQTLDSLTLADTANTEEGNDKEFEEPAEDTGNDVTAVNTFNTNEE